MAHENAIGELLERDDIPAWARASNVQRVDELIKVMEARELTPAEEVEFDRALTPVESVPLEVAKQVEAMNRRLVEAGKRACLFIMTLEVGRLLKSYRLSKGMSLEEIAERFESLDSRPDWRTPAVKLPAIDFLTELEELNVAIRCPLTDADVFADLYGMPRLMLDGILSTPIHEAKVIRQRFANFRSVGPYGTSVQYAVPKDRLAGTDHIFVHLTLEPGGVSDVHCHPGDELILVLEGEVEVRLHNMGMSQHLGQGDFCHFFAEQIHSVCNTHQRDRAKLFIVRRYQLEDGGTRRRIADDIERITNSLHNHDIATAERLFASVVRPYLSQIAPFPAPGISSPEKIHDPVGLSRFANQLMEVNNLSEDDVLAQARRVEWEREPWEILSFLAGIEINGANNEDLNKIAEILEIPPILLADFMFPAVPNCVSVRQQGDDIVKIDGSSPADYWVPCRHLAGSDVAVTFLRLQPCVEDQREPQSSPWNAHPGFELILPLKGKVGVEHGEQLFCVDSQLGEYAHYDSSETHRVLNKGDDVADVLIIRFHAVDRIDKRGCRTKAQGSIGKMVGVPYYSAALQDNSALHEPWIAADETVVLEQRDKWATPRRERSEFASTDQ